MSRFILLIGVGGFIGSVGRFLTANYLTKLYPSAFPYGTFVVNIVGCLIIGIVYGITARFNLFSLEWRLFLTTGLCGGYTTFSSFAYENIMLLQSGNYLTFTAYSISSFALGLLAVFLGIVFIKIL